MLCDTHCHLDFKEFDDDRDEVIKRALSKTVDLFINVATDLSSSQRAIDLTHSYKNIYATVGVHPHNADTVDIETILLLRDLAGEDKVVAIGEVGLDYYRRLCPKQSQIDAFRRFIRLSAELNLPLIIHSRGADEDTLSILCEESSLGIRGVQHCFSHSQDMLNQILDLGFYVSFTGNITYNRNEDLLKTIELVPLDRLLLETDAPFLSPISHRGMRNEPAYLLEIAEKISAVKKISLEELAQVTTENVKELFGIHIEEL